MLLKKTRIYIIFVILLISLKNISIVYYKVKVQNILIVNQGHFGY